MPVNLNGSPPNIGQVPTSQTPPAVDNKEETKVDTKRQEKNNDFTSYLNDQSITHEKEVVKSKEFNTADEIAQQSTYSSPSSGRTPV